MSSFEALDACLEPDVCIDEYLWSLYERAKKVDTVKVTERIKVTVKKKGKTKTVVKTLTKYVSEDFGWKDPNAAEKAGMSMKDYVIGGMDRRFKRKLYHALRAMDDAGLSPGITSGFRDDYRQGIATGNKAAIGQLIPWREPPWWLWPWACGRSREREWRDTCGARQVE